MYVWPSPPLFGLCAIDIGCAQNLSLIAILIELKRSTPCWVAGKQPPETASCSTNASMMRRMAAESGGVPSSEALLAAASSSDSRLRQTLNHSGTVCTNFAIQYRGAGVWTDGSKNRNNVGVRLRKPRTLHFLAQSRCLESMNCANSDV
jgi:hypothetical protein